MKRVLMICAMAALARFGIAQIQEAKALCSRPMVREDVRRFLFLAENADLETRMFLFKELPRVWPLVSSYGWIYGGLSPDPEDEDASDEDLTRILEGALRSDDVELAQQAFRTIVVLADPWRQVITPDLGFCGNGPFHLRDMLWNQLFTWDWPFPAHFDKFLSSTNPNEFIAAVEMIAGPRQEQAILACRRYAESKNVRHQEVAAIVAFRQHVRPSDLAGFAAMESEAFVQKHFYFFSLGMPERAKEEARKIPGSKLPLALRTALGADSSKEQIIADPSALPALAYASRWGEWSPEIAQRLIPMAEMGYEAAIRFLVKKPRIDLTTTLMEFPESLQRAYFKNGTFEGLSPAAIGRFQALAKKHRDLNLNHHAWESGLVDPRSLVNSSEAETRAQAMRWLLRRSPPQESWFKDSSKEVLEVLIEAWPNYHQPSFNAFVAGAFSKGTLAERARILGVAVRKRSERGCAAFLRMVADKGNPQESETARLALSTPINEAS